MPRIGQGLKIAQNGLSEREVFADSTVIAMFLGKT